MLYTAGTSKVEHSDNPERRSYHREQSERG
jgi:hypothetical protein